MNNSPAYVLVQYLIAQGDVIEPGESGDWPMFCAHLPDGKLVPHNACAGMDTTGVKDGRIMATGEVILHPGFQILLRSTDYNTGWDKASEMAKTLSEVDDAEVVIGSNTYTINNVTQVGDVVSLGQEEGTKRRWMFSVNCLTTIQEE